MPTEDLVSVILPAYNAEGFIDECLESITRQTYTNLEILVLDDGSTDSTLKKLTEWKSRDSRISVSSRENKGLIKTLNELISKCRGRYIARMDADDIAAADRISNQVEHLKNTEIGILGSNCLIIDEQSAKVGSYRFERKHENIKIDTFFRAPFCHPSMMFDLNKIQRQDLWYDPEYPHAEDLELWLRLLSKYKGANLRKNLIHLRRGHSTNISSVHKVAQLLSTVRAVKQHANINITELDIHNLRQRIELAKFMKSGLRVGLLLTQLSPSQGFIFFRRLSMIFAVSLTRKCTA